MRNANSNFQLSVVPLPKLDLALATTTIELTRRRKRSLNKVPLPSPSRCEGTRRQWRRRTVFCNKKLLWNWRLWRPQKKNPDTSCPTMSELQKHTGKYHAKDNSFVCSGHKQKRVIGALYDSDSISGKTRKPALPKCRAPEVQCALPHTLGTTRSTRGHQALAMASFFNNRTNVEVGR